MTRNKHGGASTSVESVVASWSLATSLTRGMACSSTYRAITREMYPTAMFDSRFEMIDVM